MGSYQKKRKPHRLQAVDIEFPRVVKGCRRVDRIKNEDIRTELQIYSLQDKMTGDREGG